ncbi:MAG: bifunctional nuclease family protein [Actinomycetia bacterium]|nr:bifunctional nuclease family protein [Actinomycetes bacterium]
MLPLDIASLAFDPSTQQPVLLLKLAGSPDPAERLVPIALGRPEAHAIISAAHGLSFSRPTTHDLLVSTMQAAGLSLERVEINSFAQGTFLATLDFLRGVEQVTVDARPSDAIALALRTHAPLFIADKVYQETSVKTQMVGADDEETSEQTQAPRKLFDDFHKFIQHVEPGDFK